MFSAAAAIEDLEALVLPQVAGPAEEPVPGAENSDVLDAVSRLGKQQLRTNATNEMTLERLSAALALAEKNSAEVREHAANYRRELQSERDEAWNTRLSMIEVIDAIDDLTAMALQKGDAIWVDRVQRLTKRTLDALAVAGASEIPAMDMEFDDSRHEAVDVVRSPSATGYMVLEVIRRGFRYDGKVLRRAQVIASSSLETT